MRTACALDSGSASTGITEHPRLTIDAADALGVGLKTAEGTPFALCLMREGLEPPLWAAVTVVSSRIPLGTSGHAGQATRLRALVLEVSSRALFTLGTRRLRRKR